jgi:hypothetical protein
MSQFGYTIVCAKTEYNMNDTNSEKPEKTFTKILDDSSMSVVTKVLTENLTGKSYECDLDHLMLFATSFTNFNKWIAFSCVYVISLEPIEHPLFLKDNEFNALLENKHSGINRLGVYNAYASHRFSNNHQGDFFHMNDENKIVIHKPITNSNGPIRSC